MHHAHKLFPVLLLLLAILGCHTTPQPQSSIPALRLGAMFSDNMVLQRDIEAPLWGYAAPDTVVQVQRDEEPIVEARADANGKWLVRLAPLPAGGPHEIRIQAGVQTAILSNVLMGDVWVCSGQSNMQWALFARRGKGAAYARNATAEINNADYPEIRLYMVPQTINLAEQQEVPLPEKPMYEDMPEDALRTWRVCSPETVPHFSAVGYFFGRAIHREVKVPVGLIQTAWGGTPVEAWISEEVLAQHPDYADIRSRVEAEATRMETAEAQANPKFPTVLYNGMIAPVLPYGIKGAIWYQGESNASRAHQYQTLFPAMIEDWRARWQQEDFPFLFVQLANYGSREALPNDSDWAELREAQTMTLALPNTGMAVTLDIGESKDIHPRNKQDVGERLALAARHVAYGEDLLHSGPTYESMTVEKDKIRLRFNNIGGGLTALGAAPIGFEIAGEDRHFFWANAQIEGETILVWSPHVPKPVAVRYGWADDPLTNLTNKEGLPAAPFRTDNWPGITENNR